MQVVTSATMPFLVTVIGDALRDNFSVNFVYPVLAVSDVISENEDGEEECETLFLVPNDAGQFVWLDRGECRFAGLHT